MPADHYLLTLSAEQLAVLRDALEVYTRLQMGQTWTVADHVDRADMGAEGKLALQAALRPAQFLITGDYAPGVSRFPTDRARERFRVGDRVYEHVRYALVPDPFVRPLAYDPRLVRAEEPCPSAT